MHKNLGWAPALAFAGQARLRPNGRPGEYGVFALGFCALEASEAPAVVLRW